MRNAIVVNLDRCTGCDACIAACKHEHGVDLGVYWNRVIPMGPYGTYPDISMYWLPTMCMQCVGAPCIEVCPTGASQRDEATGAVFIDEASCIGCQNCIGACPYGARTFLEDKGIVQKCNLCVDRLHNDELPACVHNCNTGARIYGDLDDPESDASKALAAAGDNVHRLPDPQGVEPSTAYILSPSICEWHDIDEERIYDVRGHTPSF